MLDLVPRARVDGARVLVEARLAGASGVGRAAATNLLVPIAAREHGRGSPRGRRVRGLFSGIGRWEFRWSWRRGRHQSRWRFGPACTF